MENIPRILIPSVENIETISIPLPTADVPSYVPLVVPPSDLQEPEGTKPVETVDPPKPTLPPPFPPYPLPSTEVLVPTVITAVTAVAATTVATPIIQDIKERITKFLNNKIKKWKENRDDHDEQMQILGAMVRLGVVIWSGFIITLNYVELPMVKKSGASADITFVASVFTGALATFGLTTGNGKKDKEQKPKT